MAKMNWERLKRYSRRKSTQEEIDRRNRIKKEKPKLKEARIKFKESRNPGMATKNQMKFIRRYKLIQNSSVVELSFIVASGLISKFKKKKKKERKNGKTKNNNIGHRRNSGRTRTS